jgi:hypothetical protein
MPCVANNLPFCLSSESTFAGTSTVGATASTTGVTGTSVAGLPYNFTALTDATIAGNALVSGRIVSVGVAMQYTGTTLNMGGVMRSFVDPNHSNLWGQNFAANNSNGVSVSAISRRRHVFELSAIDSDEWEYPNGVPSAAFPFSQCYPYSQGKTISNSDVNFGGAPLLIDWNSSPGNTFYVDIIVHVEYVGIAASALLTPSHADVVGFEKIAAASAMVTPLRVQYPDASSESLLATALRQVGDSLKPVAIAALTNLGKSAMGRAGIAGF